MYFPALKTAIQYLEEKKFYEVALMYLTALGYKELSIIDGTGDGGRDVSCSRPDLRIQLSVRKDWEKKINEEAGKTAAAGLHHLIYITNRHITPADEQDFIQTQYKHKGDVDVSIHDLRKIATALVRPSVIKQAYAILGMSVSEKVSATPKEIAVSTVLLFSSEARELRDEVVSASIRAQLLKNSGISESVLIGKVADGVPGTNTERTAKSILSRLRTEGRVIGSSTSVMLSDAEKQNMEAAETEFLAAIEADIVALGNVTGLSSTENKRLLNIALDLLVRNKDLNGDGPIEESLRSFISSHRLTQKKDQIYDALSRTASARQKQYGATIDQIMSTDSVDIYRALGRQTDISMVLDSSVAMPMIFGLSFGAARSRYGVAAAALRDACIAHNIKMVVPNAYLNEMAYHGQLALQYLDVVPSLPKEARQALRASRNAYLSHYSHISETLEEGEQLGLKEFLSHFGITVGRSLGRIENKLNSILEEFSITCIPDGRIDQKVHKTISEEKPLEPKVLVDHDASVCSMLKRDQQKGFILATWDKAMINVVEDIARVYADTPARVIDFLSMASGQAFENDQNFELLSTLLHTDELVAQKLARKIEGIKSTEQAFKLRSFVDAARERVGSSYSLKPEDITPFISDENQD